MVTTCEDFLVHVDYTIKHTLLHTYVSTERHSGGILALISMQGSFCVPFI